MDEGILLLERLIVATPSVEPATVEELVMGYWRLHPDRPVWHLTEDVQRQAMVYANIVDGLKSGRAPADIRIAFEQMELVPPEVLPNPDGSALAAKAFGMLSRYRETLVCIVNRFGGELLGELGFEPALSAAVQVNVGFPPSVSVSVELGLGA